MVFRAVIYQVFRELAERTSDKICDVQFSEKNSNSTFTVQKTASHYDCSGINPVYARGEALELSRGRPSGPGCKKCKAGFHRIAAIRCTGPPLSSSQRILGESIIVDYDSSAEVFSPRLL